MKLLRQSITIACVLVVALAKAEEKPGPVTDEGSSKEGKEREGMDARKLLEMGRNAGALPEGMIVRIGACLGESDGKAAGDAIPDELRETWEFTTNQVHRVVFEYKKDKSIYHRVESRAFDSKGLCKELLEGKTIEIQARKGEGPQIGFVGSPYHRGSRSIEVVWRGETILNLHETNGAFLDLYRESDARAFGALYERLASQARIPFQLKAAPANKRAITWGDAVNGLQMGISPAAGTKGAPTALFDGKTLQLDVHLRNAGETTVYIIPNTFGCAAMGSGAAIPVTKLVLTPSKGGEPLFITYQGMNHVSDQRHLDADDVKYYTSVLKSGQARSFAYTVSYTPGEARTTSWQRTGGPNLVPEGKYQVKAVIVVDRKESQWKGELTSGSLEVEIGALDKK